MRPAFKTSVLAALERRRARATRTVRDAAKELFAAERPFDGFAAAAEAAGTVEACRLVVAALETRNTVTVSPLQVAEAVARCLASIPDAASDTFDGYARQAVRVALRAIDIEALMREARGAEAVATDPRVTAYAAHSGQR